MSNQESLQSWKAFAGSVRAQFSAPTDRDLDRLLGRRHKLAPKIAEIVDRSLGQSLAAQPTQEPARL
jgi:hypothetical protein